MDRTQDVLDKIKDYSRDSILIFIKKVFEKYPNAADVWGEIDFSKEKFQMELKRLVEKGQQEQAILLYKAVKESSIEEARVFIDNFEERMRNGC